MTSAHRATWRSARGGEGEDGSFRLHVGTAAVSAKATPSHRALKLRDGAAVGADRAALRAALEADEAGGSSKSVNPAPPPLTGPASAAVRALDDDVELADDEDAEPVRKRSRVGVGLGVESDDSDSDADDEEALMAELAKIRAERAAERAAAAEHEAQQEAEQAADNPLLGNLLDDDAASVATGTTATTAASAMVKRRWNDDVVFKDQARGERRPDQRFVNDTVRNDFHRRFLRRYVL